MNLLAQFPELNISASTLTEKKQQTTKKWNMFESMSACGLW